MDIRLTRLYDGTDVYLALESGNVVGAIAAFFPDQRNARLRIGHPTPIPLAGHWPNAGRDGLAIAPTPLKLPLLKRSESRVPPWVISCMVLARLKALLDSLSRRFELVNENRLAPRGTVRWTQYATQYFATGQFLSVPCTFPDLRDDRLLVGAIRYSLEKQ